MTLDGHTLLLHRDLVEFESGAARFLRAALEEGRRTLVVAGPEKLDAIREGLGRAWDALLVADPTAYYGRLGPMFLQLARFVAGRGAEAPAAVLGEAPVHDLRPAARAAYLRFEAASNPLYAKHGASAMCAYDVRLLSEPALAGAECVHPHVIERGDRRPSAGFVEPRRYVRLRIGEREAAGGRAVAMATARDLARLRRRVRECAGARDGSPALDDFLIAVTEVATNALVHGAAPRRAAVSIEDGDIVCRIRDAGPGIGDPLAAYTPPLGSARGRGLWVAMALTDVLEIAADERGSEVALRLRLSDARASRYP